MFNKSFNNATMVNIFYNMLDKTYQTKQIVGEELIMPLVAIKKTKEVLLEKDMFIYETYKIFNGWETTNNRLPKTVPNKDTTYNMNVINIGVAYENFEISTNENEFNIIAVIKSSNQCYYNRAFCNNASVKLEFLDELPSDFSNQDTNEEESKKYDENILSSYEYNEILKFKFTDLDLTTAAKELKLLLPVYKDELKLNLLTTLELNVTAIKVNNPVGD